MSAQPFTMAVARRDEAELRRQALRRFMRDKGLKAKSWAKKAGVPDGSIRSFLAKRTHSLSHPTLERLASAADASISELIGEKLAEMKNARDVVPVRRVSVRASMGGGFDVQDESEAPPIYFRREWVRDILADQPGELFAIDGVGNSMSPTINDGDIVVALRRTEVDPPLTGDPFVLWDGHGLVIKRLEYVLGDRKKLRVISDNRAVYEPYVVSVEDVRIIGRVIWRGGKI